MRYITDPDAYRAIVEDRRRDDGQRRAEIAGRAAGSDRSTSETSRSTPVPFSTYAQQLTPNRVSPDKE